MRIKLLIVFFFTSLFAEAQTFTVDTIAYNGDPNNRINLIIMGDGYMVSEMSTFRSDALLVANYFFSVPPFSQYRNFFNVFGIEVVSNESGNDHPATASDEVVGSQPITSVDNYLETTFDYGGTHRCIYSSQGSLVYSIANTNFPMYDFINVIVNTTYYGGCAGGIAYTSMNSSSPEVFVHEFGHMFGNLSDEYDYGSSCSPGTSQNINVTQVTDPNTIVWKNWLTTAPLPTPAGTNCGLIGAYEGAKYCATDWYRPKCNCKMRSLNQPLCEVCIEQLIYKVSTYVNYIESFSPSNTATINLCKSATLNFSANVLNSTANTVRSQWLVDNVVVVNNNTSFTFNPSSLTTGIHEVKLIAYDTTVQAKRSLTSYQTTWSVNVLPLPAATAGSNGTTFCSGQTLNLTATGTGSYSWAGPNGYTSTSQNPSISGLDSTRNGSYTVTATNSCGTSSSSVSVTVSSSINASIAAQGPLSFCSGGSVVLDAGANTSRSFQWFENSSPVSGATSHDFTVFQSGSYTVRVTITGTTCTASSSPVSVTVHPVPTATVSTNDPRTFCQGGSALLQAQTGTSYTYQWFRNNQLIGAATTNQLSALITGAYKVVATLGTCRDTSSSISILVNPNPDNSMTVTGDTVFCEEDTVSLSVSNCGTCSYQWQLDSTNISGAVFNSFQAGVGGFYRSVILDNSNGCSSLSRSVYVDVHLLPSDSIVANGNPSFCNGDSVILSVPFVSGYSYNWFLNAQPLGGIAGADLTAKNPGDYTVIVGDVVCSSQSDPFTVTVYPNPVVSINSLPDTMCIYNGTISLQGFPGGGMFSGDGVIDSTFNPAMAGNGNHLISYTYANVNGCADSGAVAVFVDICLSLATVAGKADFTIFPNPASGMLTVQYTVNSPSGIYFRLIDITGRLVQNIERPEISGENSFSLNAAEFSPGVYFLEMIQSGMLTTKKIIITRD